MLFNSADFLFFFPIVLLVFFILPQKIRYIWLLLASYYFYMQWNPKYLLLLFGCTLVTYVAGLLIEKNKNSESSKKQNGKRKKLYLITALVLVLGVLAFYKYFDFILLYMNQFLNIFHISGYTRKFDIILPVGISFFTLQSIGYLIDVYRDEIYAEKNFFRYALFVSFFPQLVAGPIERSKNLLVQLSKPTKFDYENLRKGVVLILWGLFCKMVIADRIAIIVDTVYERYTELNGFYIVFAAILFSFQIYCDFHGYSTIARGVALTFGYHLVDNFEAPYFSKSIKEFWRRWHISLSYWFRDYLYIPLGGNRKGKLRKELNLLVVFGISGLWHGASLGYVFWGGLNGFYQVVSNLFHDITKKVFPNMGERRNTFSRRFSSGLITFALVTFTWIFFRAGSLAEGLRIIKKMLVPNWTVLFDGSLCSLGVEGPFIIVAIVSIFVLMLVDYQKYKGKNVVELLLAQEWWFRIITLVTLVMAIFLFGCYGEMYDTQQFIYFQF